MAAKKLTVAIAGNPNSGKTTIFNNLTGTRHRVGNWAGVTVEKKEGFVSHDGTDITFVDLPGTYSLSAYSMEEVIARRFVVEEHPDVVVNVLDAANLERNLYLTTQILELGTKVILVMNMVDTAKKRGIFIDMERLAKLTGVTVVETVGNRNKGTDEIIQAVINSCESKNTSHIRLSYGDDLERHIKEVSDTLSTDKKLCSNYSARWLSVKLFEKDKEVLNFLDGNPLKNDILKLMSKAHQHMEELYGNDSEAIMAEHRYGFIHGLCKELMHKSVEDRIIVSDKIDMFLTNRLLGIPIFLGIMWLMFTATFTLGEIPMGWIESLFAVLSNVVRATMPAGLLRDLIVNGIITGLSGIIIFLPNIMILFLFISFFEDTGYMARAAFIMDRVMHTIGLHGKSFIPLLMGFGCNVPAIMATRTLESKRDRILSILINPYISCNARLPIYVLFAGAFFPDNANNIIFSLYILGICVSILSGMLFKKLFFKGESEPFIMELPPYRLPTLRGTAIHMWDKGVIFIKKIWRVVMVGAVLVWFLGNFPENIKYSRNYNGEINNIEASYRTKIANSGNGLREKLEREKESKISDVVNQQKSEHQEKTYIGKLGKFIVPVFKPLGFDWKNSVSLICGFVAKEIVVSTHGVLFKVGEGADEDNTSLVEALRESHMTPLTAYAFMVFTLLYTPCLATVGIMKKETGGWKWTSFSITYSLVIAWMLSFLVYRVGLIAGIGL